MTDQSRTFFLCGIAWQHEIGETTVRLWNTLEELKEHHRCTEECGAVKLTVTREWVIPQDFGKMVAGAKKLKQLKKRETNAR